MLHYIIFILQCCRFVSNLKLWCRLYIILVKKITLTNIRFFFFCYNVTISKTKDKRKPENSREEENYCRVYRASSFQIHFIKIFKTKIDTKLITIITRINLHCFLLIKVIKKIKKPNIVLSLKN